MYVPAWQTLHVAHLRGARRHIRLPFPLDRADLLYVYLARNAIFSLFRALRLREDEIVLAPSYHSGNEIKAIRAAGATVRYYPVRRDFTMDLDEVDRLAARGARVLYVIHYLGWGQPLDELLRIARDRGLILVEDCALSFLSRWGGRPLGSFGSYSVFCLYKTLAVPDGGLLVQNEGPNPEIHAQVLRQPGRVTTVARTVGMALEGVRTRSDRLGRGLSTLKEAGGSLLTRAGIRRVPVGDMAFRIQDADLGMTPFSRALLGRFPYEEIRSRRRENYTYLRERLSGSIALPPLELSEDVCPLFFPILVDDKKALARALRRSGISAVEFWNTGEPDADPEEFPDTAFLRRHVLELPIHQDITPMQLDHIVSVLRSISCPAPS